MTAFQTQLHDFQRLDHHAGLDQFSAQIDFGMLVATAAIESEFLRSSLLATLHGKRQPTFGSQGGGSRSCKINS